MPRFYQLLSSPFRDEDQPSLVTQDLNRRSHIEFPKEKSHRSWGPSVRKYSQPSNQEAFYAPGAPVSSPLIGQPWRTGYFRNIPWRGIGSLLLALSSTLASAILLAVSNGDSVASWKVSPSVVLALLSALSTACLSYALVRGLNVSWWRKVLEGVPLNDTHRYWDHGTNTMSAIAAGRQFSLLSIAKLLVTLAAIAEGPFIQQASTISTREVSMPILLNASLAANLPSGYTASVTGESRFPDYPSAVFSTVFDEYSNRAAISRGFDGCPGRCKASVPGVGFKVSCVPNWNTSWNMDDYGNGGTHKPQFTANTDWKAQGSDGMPGVIQNGSIEYITVSAGWAINSVQPLEFTNRFCNLSLAIVAYPVEIVNDTISLGLALGTDPDVLHDLPSASTPPGFQFTGPTTLGGFTLIGGVNQMGSIPVPGPFYADVSMVANGAAALYSLYGASPFAWSHAVNPNWDVNNPDYVWRDPIPDILAAYHEIMFRLGISAATDPTLVKPIECDGTLYTSVRMVPGTYIFIENYYVSNFGYLGGAMAVILLAIFSIMPTLYGWWKIGRRTTLSPLETAKAFGAPLLSDCNSNGTIEDLIHSVKHQVVKYGATERSEECDSWSKLRILEYGSVYAPKSETAFRR